MSRLAQPAPGPRFKAALFSAVLTGCVVLPLTTAKAQERLIPHRATPHGQPIRTAARPLTVHRHTPRSVVFAGHGYPAPRYDAPSLVRRWNDPNLYSFGGWRIGGDNFYGDTRGDPITRGNAALGMISGYGPARGGYGGPHFDSIGGFHNGPGPDAQEADDYASGSISEPDYGGAARQYPGVKARVARLNTGIPGTIGPVRASFKAGAEPASFRPAALPDGSRGEEGLSTGAPADDALPDLGLGDF